MKKRYILLGLLLLFFGHLLFRIILYKDNYTSKFDSVYWKNRYLQSQWVAPSGCAYDPHINPKTCVWDDAWYAAHQVPNYKPVVRESIGDDGLYAYAGWEYVNGKDPTLLNAEMPPLGKYLIGASILVFQNQNVFALFSGVLALLGLFLLSKFVIKDTFFAVLSVVLFSFEPLFYTQLRAPFLDLLYLALLCFVFYFFLKKQFLLSFFTLGLMMATKASIATLGLVLASELIYIYLSKQYFLVKKIALYSPIAIGVFIAVYARYFFLGHSLREFLGVQKWVLNFYVGGAKGNIGDVFQILLSGKWLTWWDKTLTTVSEWQITWPIVFILSVILFVAHVKEKKKDISAFLQIWVGVYILFLMVIPVFPRYLLVVLPFLYILSSISVFQFLKRKRFQ